MKSKYIGTIVGLGFSMPGLLSFLSLDMNFFMFIPILAFFPIALPLELLGNKLFDDHALSAGIVILGLILAFTLTSYYFFSHLINDRKTDRPVNKVRFWGYFGIQIIIIHPLILYILAFKKISSSGDGQFIFAVFETFPISSGLFFILGLTIDFVKNKKRLPTKPKSKRAESVIFENTTPKKTT